MGEFSEQLMSGGPELLALPADPVIGEALTSMQAYPEEWWCELQELQPKLRRRFWRRQWLEIGLPRMLIGS